jgi:hypothetical protein
LSFVAAPATAQPAVDEWGVPAPAWEGVWVGAVGAFPVHVCLDKTPYEQKGAYYYDRTKGLLRLEPGATDGEWIEQVTYGRNGARWSLSVDRGEIVGVWNEGPRKLPIRLKRIGGPSQDFDGPCGSMTFHRPRAVQGRLTSKAGSLGGTKFTTWTFTPGPWLADAVAISTFTLDRPGLAAARVDALLRAVLPKSDGTGEWLDCVAQNVNTSSMDGTWAKTVEPTLISDHWLAANEHTEDNCGGPHPNYWNRGRTFDLVAGAEVDPLDWLGTKALTREDLGSGVIHRTLKPTFVAVILKGWKDVERPDCDEAMRTQTDWSAGIAPGALVFSPVFPHVIKACGEEFKVPLARLQPWLNEKGVAAAATLPR